MHFRRPIVKLALIVAAALIIGLAVPATLSYLTSGTNSLYNIFKPDYVELADGVVDVYVQKEVTNLLETPVGKDNFQFLLTRTDNENAIKLVTDEDGRAHAALTFSNADAGKTYTYRLSEVNDGRENMVYDDTVYTITVSLKINDDVQLIPTVKLNGLQVDKVECAFTNVATTEVLPPDTGDHSHPLLYAALMVLGIAGASLVIVMNKKRSA